MGNSKLAQLLLEARQRGFEDGLYQGLQFGVNLTHIANNHVHGHGEKRIMRTHNLVQKLVDEVVDVNDPDVTEAHIKQEMKRIRRKAYEEDT